MGANRKRFDHDGISSTPLMPLLPFISSILSYNSETGEFRWLAGRGKASAGASAGYMRPDGYMAIGVNRQYIKSHRLAWILHFKEEPPALIDHINRDRADNRISNLRAVTNRENNLNRDGRPNGNSIGGTISRNPKGHCIWRARIWHFGAEKTRRTKTFCGAYKALLEMRAA